MRGSRSNRLFLLPLRRLPKRLHLVQRGVFGFPPLRRKTGLDRLEAADEFGIGGAQRVFRVKLQMPREIAIANSRSPNSSATLAGFPEAAASASSRLSSAILSVTVTALGQSNP